MSFNMHSSTGPERFMLPERFNPPVRFTSDAPPESPYSTAVYTAPMPAIVFYNHAGTQLSAPALEQEAAREIIKNTFDDLDRIAGLPADWDSYGSPAPTKKAVETARRLIMTVYGEALLSARNPSLPYSVAPLSGGGVQLEWRGENKATEVQVSPDGAFGYLLVKGAEPSCAYEEGDGAPESRILELVRSVQR